MILQRDKRLELVSEHLADRAEAAERYADLIQAWDAGAKTVPAIAVALKVSNFAIINRFKAAQRRGLLT